MATKCASAMAFSMVGSWWKKALGPMSIAWISRVTRGDPLLPFQNTGFDFDAAFSLVGRACKVNSVKWNAGKGEAKLLGRSHYPYSASSDDVRGEEMSTRSGKKFSCISHHKEQQNPAVSSWPSCPCDRTWEV